MSNQLTTWSNQVSLLPMACSTVSPELQERVLEWINEKTGYNITDHSPITWKQSTVYYSYILETKTGFVSREMEENEEVTEETECRKGVAIQDSFLWGDRDDLLVLETLKQEKGWEDFRFKLDKTETVEICPSCNGKKELLCHRCHGTHEYECDRCDGVGWRYMTEACPKCDGRGERHLWGKWRTCSYCEGRKRVREKVTCSTCDGTGERTCYYCDEDGYDVCEHCEGSGHVLKFYSIHQTYRSVTGKRYWLGTYIPKELREELNVKEDDPAELIAEWDNSLGPLDGNIPADFECNLTAAFSKAIREAAAPGNESTRPIHQTAKLYHVQRYAAVDFAYEGVVYTAWVSLYDHRVYEFEPHGFCSAWRRAVATYRAKMRFAEKFAHSINPLKGKKINFLKISPVALTDEQKKASENHLVPPRTFRGDGIPQTEYAERKKRWKNFIGSLSCAYTVSHPSYVLLLLLAILLPGSHALYYNSFMNRNWAYPVGWKGGLGKLKLSNDIMKKGVIQMLLTLTIFGYPFALIWSLIDFVIILAGKFESKPKIGTPLLIIAAAAVSMLYFAHRENLTEEQEITHPIIETECDAEMSTGEAMLILEKAKEMERQDNARVIEQIVEALSPKHYVTGKIVMLQERPQKPFVVKKLSNGNMRINGWVQLSVNRQLYEELWQQGFAQRFIAEGAEHAVIARHDYPLRDSDDRMAKQNAAHLKELQKRSVSLSVPAPCMYRLNAFAEQCKRWKNVLFVQTGSNSFTAFNIAHPSVDFFAAFVKDHTTNMSKMTMQVHLLDSQGNEVKTCYISNIDEGALWNGGPLYRQYAGGNAVIVSPEFMGSEHERYGQVSVGERLFAFSAELKPEELARVNDITVSVEMPQVSQDHIARYAEYFRRMEEENNKRLTQEKTLPQPNPNAIPAPQPKTASPLQPDATQVNLSELARQNNQDAAAIPTIKALYEQLSPAACLAGNLVQLSDKQLFRLKKRGSQTELSAWVELKIDPVKYARLVGLIHEHMKILPHKTLTRHPKAVPSRIIRSSRRELKGCEQGDFADTSKLQSNYRYDPNIFSNLHALYLCTHGETFAAYDLSAVGKKTPYMLEMLRLQRQKPQQFILRMHLLNAHNEEVTTFTHLIDLYSDKFNAPLYAGGQNQAPDMVVLPEFCSFVWANFTPGSGAPHLVTYPSRIVNISGAINPQDLEEITSVTFSFEWPSALSEQEAQNLAKLYNEQKQ